METSSISGLVTSLVNSGTSRATFQFPTSRRGLTSMKNFLPSTKINVLKSTPKINEWIHVGIPFPIETISNEINYVIPVSRYGSSDGIGMYYKTVSPNICGTFYYWEPGSTILLNMGTRERFRFYHTKLDAALELSKILPSGTISNDLVTAIDDTHRSIKEVTGWSYDKIDRYFSGMGDSEFDPITWTVVDGDSKLDVLYAKEDSLDQPLCFAAANLGIDVLLLSNMPGHNGSVTEILDTRPRNQSYSNLIQVVA